MSWASLGINQCISYNNLQDAVNNGIFTAIAGIPASTQQIQKSDAQAEIVIPNPSYPPYAIKASNQLLVKGDLYATGTVTLGPQYGMYFTGISGTNFPSFSYPVNSTQSANYINQIPAQTFSVTLNGNMVTSPLNISLYVDGAYITCQNITSSGSQTKTFTLPNNVYAPSVLYLSISSGSCPVTPPTPNFNNMAFSSASVSRTTGQYQVLAQTSTYYSTPGYLYISSDYGATWTQKFSAYGYWWKVASSDNGQYMLALEYGSGNAWLSSNYGFIWTPITNFPGPTTSNGGSTHYIPLQKQNFKGAALSSDGAIQCIVTGPTVFTNPAPYPGHSSNETAAIIWMSTDYGATWHQSADQAAGHTLGYDGESFSSVAMDSSGTHIYISKGDIFQPIGCIYYSTDYCATLTIASGSSTAANISDIATIADGSVVSATSYSGQYYTRVLRSTNYGVSFDVINHGSPAGIDQNSWHKCCIFKFNSTEVDTFATPNYGSQIYYSPINSAYTTPYVYPWTNTISQNWTSLNCSNNGTYMLMTSNLGAWKSINGGSTFIQL